MLRIRGVGAEEEDGELGGGAAPNKSTAEGSGVNTAVSARRMFRKEVVGSGVGCWRTVHIALR